MMPLTLNEQAPVPPPAYYRVKARLVPALHMSSYLGGLLGYDMPSTDIKKQINQRSFRDARKIGNITIIREVEIHRFLVKPQPRLNRTITFLTFLVTFISPIMSESIRIFICEGGLWNSQLIS